MIIKILDLAERDLLEGFLFYEAQQQGLGSYFLSNLYGEIESLQLYAGIHEKLYKDYRRLLAHRFPFAIYYTVEDEDVSIHAVVDCRKNPAWLRKRLT